MNWTGGRLQRHSKTNSNTQIKAQKQHFARARLRKSNKPSIPTSLRISIAAAHHRQEHSARSLAQQPRHPAIDAESFQDDRIREDRPKHVVQNTSVSDQIFTQNRRPNLQTSPGTSSLAVNTLERVKRNLLNQPDWLGLASARPPKTEHRLAVVSEQIGRRRRVTREDRHRQKHSVGQRKIEHNLFNPFSQANGVRIIQPIESENVSIRIGSKIHQSQATRSQHPPDKPSSAVPESSSTEPMLLDLVEAQMPMALKGQREYYLRYGNNVDYLAVELTSAQQGLDQDVLIPLEQARNFASFDEVKRYSSSAKYTTSSSLSVPKQQTQVSTGSQPRPLQHSSSSVVRGKPVDDQGLFSSDCSSQRFASISSEPPRFLNRLENTVMEDTNHGTDKACDPPPFHHLSTASTTSPCASERHNRICSSPGDESGKMRSSYARDAQREILPSRYSRPPYTLERQVHFEAELKRQTNHRARPVNNGNDLPVNRNTQRHRGFCRAERPLARQEKDSPKPCATKSIENTNQDDNHQGLHIKKKSFGNGSRRQGDEIEAWMRDVFSTDFDELSRRFSFAKAPVRKFADWTPPRHLSFRNLHTKVVDKPEHPSWGLPSSQPSSDLSLPRTIKTGANTTLNVRMKPEQPLHRNLFLPSEKDFLSRMSPMTGYLDDRIDNISTYNNFARTTRSFVGAPHKAVKRSASDAFDDDHYDNYDHSGVSKGSLAPLSSPGLDRTPLDTLHQALLRPHPDLGELPATNEDPQHISRPVWRHVKAPSSLNIDELVRILTSKEKSEHIRTPHSQIAQFSLNYALGRTSASRSRLTARLEAPIQTLDPAASMLSPQFSSPKDPSRHRVPLTSRLEVEGTGIDHDEQQSLSGHFAAYTNSTLSTPSTQFTARERTSSGSNVSAPRIAGPTANIHTTGGQPFIFKRPQRPTAQYNHPSRATPHFKTPPSVPLH